MDQSIRLCACGCGAPIPPARYKRKPNFRGFVHGHNGGQGTLEERFWRNVVQHDDGCWEWTGYKTAGGYGAFFVGGQAAQKMVYAHRVSYELHHGPLADGLHACHRCDNPGCPRPDHLFAGTPEDNTRDSIRKGRFWSQRRVAAATPRPEDRG